MNQIGKILVVFIAVASISFMGFATVLLVGGPNYQNDIDRLKDRYRITQTSGDEPVYESYRIVGEERAAQDPSLAKVLNQTYDQALSDLNNEIGALQQDEQRFAAMAAEIEAANAADVLALQARADTLRVELDSLRAQTEAIGQQVQVQQDEVLKIQERLNSRRDDVFRLQAQYDEIYVDQFRAEQIIGQLTQLIHQIDGELERARRRETQLVEQGAALPGDNE
jgi:chromosome segregation ATPase